MNNTRRTRNERIPVRFSLYVGEGHEVCLAGDFNEWDTASTPLMRNGRGHYLVHLDLTPGRHEYRYVVDGHWENDPMADATPNPFGSMNSVIVVEEHV